MNFIPVKYFFIGIAIGFIFPIVATLADLNDQGLAFTLENIIDAHSNRSLYRLIDIFPLIMGFLGIIIGKKQRRIIYSDAIYERKLKERMNALENKHQALGREIKSRKNIEEKLIQAKESAETGLKTKVDFLRHMSHELRTPLNAVIGMTNYLITDNPRPEQLEKLDILRFSANNLLAIINNILDFSKVDIGEVSSKTVAIDLNQLLQRIVESYRFKAKENNNSLIISIDKVPSSLIEVDVIKLSQVLNNLIDNALKFTHNGMIQLASYVLEEDDDSLTILFSVKDSGVGIHKKYQQDIFEAFYQGSVSDDPNREGTGLGLTISKRLVQLMGSDIIVESSDGRGATFSFQLLLKKVDPKAEGESEPDNLPLNNKRILVVEDNLINQKVILQYLKKWGADIDIAENGLAAIAQVSKPESHYDIIIMDLQMPEMDGYETTRVIRKLGSGRHEHLPIIALTASALVEVKDEVLAAGMNAYITKPFQPTELKKVLIDLMH